MKHATKARSNGKSLRSETIGGEKVVRAHCASCDSSGTYCYTDIYSLITDMGSEDYFYGKWEFTDYRNTIKALCPSCVKLAEGKK
jgi:hypothetical protein